MAAFGSLAGISALPAFAALGGNTLTSASYIIGSATGSPTNVTASTSSTSSSAAALYTVSFRSPDGALTVGGTITLTESDSAGAIFGAGSAVVAANVVVEDASNPSAYAPQAAGSIVKTAGSLAITLGGAGTIAAGDTVMVQVSTHNPAVTANTAYTIGVSTSADGTTANASPITIAAGAAAAGVSAAPLTPGGNGLYTFSTILLGGSGTTNTLSLAATVGTSASTTLWSSGGASAYSVTDTPSGGTAHTVTVSSVAGGGTATATLTLGSTVAATDTLTITAYGTNPPAGTNTYAVGAGGGTVTGVAAGTVAFGSSVSNVTLTPSPATAGVASTYIVSFKATSALTAAQAIIITVPSDTTLTTVSGTTTVTDPTSGLLHTGSTTVVSGAGHVLTVTPGIAIAAGDTVNVTFGGATNPSTAETETSASVSTTTDAVAATAAGYAIGISTAGSVSVVVNPITPGVTATYTVSGFSASDGTLTAGVGDLELSAVAGTVFPALAGDYVVTDSTNSGGSGTVSVVPTITNGGATAEFVVPNTITSGDKLTVTVADVLNPSSGTKTLTVLGAVGAVTLPIFPMGGSTYPDGGIVNFAGTYYVFAGGHAFGFPTVASLVNVQTVDPAKVQTAATGVTVPTATARIGTLIDVYGNPTVWVIGADGQLHGFATPTQLLQDGYDGADIITVPNIGGLTVSTTTVGVLGAAANAFATSSDGAIVNSSGTYYVFAGGRAFGIPTPAALTIVLTGNPYSAPQTGTISSASTTTVIANGVVVTLGGTVYVSSGGSLYAFKSYAQLTTDGYSGTPSIIVPNAGGMSAVTSYAGS